MATEKKIGIFKVSHYEFMREVDDDHENHPAFEMINIRVKKLIDTAGSTYRAIPEKNGFMELIQASNEFVGKGETEEEALKDCVGKIKTVAASEIFPKRKNKS